MSRLKGYNYNDLFDLLCAPRNRKKYDMVIGNNTRARFAGNPEFREDKDNVITVKLRNSDIVRLYPSGNVEFSLRGWATVTTRQRINCFLPKEWYICTNRNVPYVGGWVYSDSYPEDGSYGDRRGLKEMSEYDWYSTDELPALWEEEKAA